MTELFYYRVLYLPGVGQQRQEEVKGVIEQRLPKGRGEVFIPRMELYRRGDKAIREVSIFPGYVFLYTDLNLRQTHELLKDCREEVNAYIGELALRQRREGEPAYLHRGDGSEALYELSDLDGEETEFLDLLREGDGLLKMSCGYEENRKCHVMEGPLRAFESRIEKLDKHNRKAFLRFEINGRQVRAGFECKPKSYWFPKESTRIVKLTDGVEVDLEDLVQKMKTK